MVVNEAMNSRFFGKLQNWRKPNVQM